MPLVAHTELPTFDRLRSEGLTVLTPDRAAQQNIRPLHVGLLNMMPDAALAATERQFYRLIGSSNPISQFVMHPFTIDDIPRSESAADHIQRYYEPFADIQDNGLDALIVSGANVTRPHLDREIFWPQLCSVLDWAEKNVTSTLCSCLATHAVMLARYNVRRQPLDTKCWGVYEHDVVRRDHPLVRDVNTRLFVPHSRGNEITRTQFEQAGLHVLIEGSEPGVQLAVSPDGIRGVYFQGHPEYDRISLMKEYKRDIGLYLDGKTDQWSPYPRHYFDEHCKAILAEFGEYCDTALANKSALPAFPESLVQHRLHNTWHDSGEAIVGNWIGLVYQITHRERNLPFMEGVDPADPLGWLAA